MSDETRSNADILRAAKARITEPRHFVMGALAWDREGRPCDIASPDAWRWNPRGAVYAESGIRPSKWDESDRGHALYRFLDQAARAIVTERQENHLLSQDASDNLGHALSLRMFDDAIALAEGAGDE